MSDGRNARRARCDGRSVPNIKQSGVAFTSTGKGGAEHPQRLVHEAGIEALKRPGNDGAAANAQSLRALLIIRRGKRRREESLVFLHRKTHIDDVKMSVVHCCSTTLKGRIL